MAIDLIIADSIQQTITECVEVIGNNFALDTLKANGVVSMEEVNTVRAIAAKILTEGQEDLIPENLEIPDMPAAPMGVAEDTTESLEDLDLDVSDLEGIILATADGSEFVVQDGILVPYTLGGTGDAMALDVSEDEDDVVDAAAAQNAAFPRCILHFLLHGALGKYRFAASVGSQRHRVCDAARMGYRRTQLHGWHSHGHHSGTSCCGRPHCGRSSAGELRNAQHCHGLRTRRANADSYSYMPDDFP